MLNPDDLDPPRPAQKMEDLEKMSIHELEDYIADLETEITRAQTMIQKKKDHKSGIESLFRSP